MGNNMPSIWSQKSMIFLTWYFEVCQKLRREVWIVDFWLFSFSFIHVEQTNICKTCSVTQIRGGRMRIGRDGSWQEATGLSKNLTAALAPNGSSGRKKLGQRRLEMSPLWECYFAVTTIVGLPISWGTQANKIKLRFWHYTKRTQSCWIPRDFVRFSLTKKLCVCFFLNYILDGQADPNLLGDTSSLTLTGHRAKL